jgi:peptidyl-prolyl cis-trans isomerase D
MFKFFRRHRTVVMIALAACVGGLVLFGVGSSSFMASPQDAIAKVNGKSITGQQFDRVFRAMSLQKPDATPAQQKEMMGQALNEIIREEVLSKEAQRYGLQVTDDELRMQLAAIPAFQKDGQFDEATYRQVVRRMFGEGADEFEKNHRKDLLVRKLNLLIAAGVQVSDAEADASKDAVLAAEKDPKERAKAAANENEIRDRVRDKQVNLVFTDWLAKMNSDLKVTIVSDQFRQRLGGGPQQ